MTIAPTETDLVLAPVSPDPQDTTYLTGQALIDAVKASGLSHSKIAAGIGKSSATVSLYLAGKYTGNVAGIEVALREWLRDHRTAVATGVATIDTEISKSIGKRIEEIRVAGELGLVIGAAGLGKTRGQSNYLIDHTLAIGFRVRPWNRGINGLGDDLAHAADINRSKRGLRRWELIIEKTSGSGRLLIVDDAHELSYSGLQCCVDWHEETGNPVMLFGLPLLEAKLRKDARRARRIGDVFHLGLRDPEPLVAHLVDQLAGEAGSERNSLIQLGIKVATQEGHFGALEKQLKKTTRLIRKRPDAGWVGAFKSAHKHLLRQYDL